MQTLQNIKKNKTKKTNEEGNACRRQLNMAPLTAEICEQEEIG